MRISIVILVIISAFITSGCSMIVLRPQKPVEVPFQIAKGDYPIKLYKISYPEEIGEKEKFYSQFDIFLKKILLSKKIVSIVLDESFFEDYELIKNAKSLLGEEIVYKVASSLSPEEIIKLRTLTGDKRIELFKETVQENLNLQIYFLLKTLNEESTFDENRLYTELNKEDIMNRLKLKRQEMMKVLTLTNIEMVVEVKDVYKPIVEKLDYKKYYYTKDIVFSKNISFDNILTKYPNNPVFLGNVKQEELEIIIEKNTVLKNRFVLVNNTNYYGYKTNKGDAIFFLSGKKEFYTHKEYKIKAEIKDSNFEEIINLENGNLLRSIFGGK